MGSRLQRLFIVLLYDDKTSSMFSFDKIMTLLALGL